MSTLLERPSLVVVLVMLGIAAITDYRTGLIPNAVAAFGAAAGVLVQLLGVALGHTELSSTLLQMGLGLAVCSFAPLLLYHYGALGGGDVKLFAAVGLCLGPLPGINVQLWAHVLALAAVPFQLARHGAPMQMVRNIGLVVRNLFVPADARSLIDYGQFTPLRFAPAIFAAALWVGVFGAELP